MDQIDSGAGCYSERTVKQTRARSCAFALSTEATIERRSGVFLAFVEKGTRNEWKTRLKREELQRSFGWVAAGHDRDG
jgi:hypothetical protein